MRLFQESSAARTATLHLHRKPVVLLDADGFYAGLVDWLAALVPVAFASADALSMLKVVPDVGAAFKTLEESWTR